LESGKEDQITMMQARRKLGVYADNIKVQDGESTGNPFISRAG